MSQALGNKANQPTSELCYGQTVEVCPVDNQEASILKSLQQAKGLRQSILKKAFPGQLVRQDSNDELVPLLLDRIQTKKSTDQRRP